MKRRTFFASSAAMAANIAMAQDSARKRIAYPRSKIVSLFTEQVPKDDMSRERAKKYGVPIVRTVYDALTLGTGQLAVDGVFSLASMATIP